jgi:adenine-specific DNA-methyltransferase
MTDDRLLAAKKKFSRLLKEIFQFDCADLDFGIYRILAMRRTELERFLDDELLPQVEGILAAAAGDRASVQSELSKLEGTLRDAGIQDFSSSPKWNELKGKLAASPDVAALAREVFSDLTTFFARYYDEGDFMALPRYKGDTYAIPYDGSEVKLHWANADQYYIKTTEQHADYTAVIDGVSGLEKPRLRFRLAAAESDRDNNKSTEKRRYVLRGESPVELDGNQLTVWFEYRVPEPGSGRQPAQSALCDEAEKAVLAAVPQPWQAALTRKASQNPEKYTVLGYQLYRYTKKNTSDYFIHKDLGGFLRRELDFFIKNEVLFLDDIEGRTSAEIDVALQKVKAIRAVGGKIIDWLAQIEDFQRQLWLKRKLVVRTRWFEVDAGSRVAEISADHGRISRGIADGDDIGLLVRSENFGALRMLQASLTVDAIYIDPPYNSPSSEIAYKNNYKHASWLSLMADRLSIASKMLDGASNPLLMVAIDENESERLGLLLDALFPNLERTCISLVHNPRGIQGQNFSYSHEYVYFLHRPGSGAVSERVIPETEREYSNLRNWGGESLRTDAKTCFYPILVRGSEIVGFGDVLDDAIHPPSRAVTRQDGVIEVWPIDSKGVERKWRYARSTVEGIVSRLRVVARADGPDVQISQEREKFRTLWQDSRHDAGSHGTRLLTDMGLTGFSFPKSVHLVDDCLAAGLVDNPVGRVLDFFAGSGTTAHALLNLNRRDGGKRRFALAEMGDYFDTVTLPRVLKAAQSSTWKSGQPTGDDPVPMALKVIELESYDDTLENVELNREAAFGDLFASSHALREDYTLRYMLNLEAEGSLLNLERFRKPWDYTIKVRRDGVVQDSPVDLVETFNYLIGLRVKRYDTYGQEGLLFVIGTDPEGRRVIVVWRDCDLWPNDRLEEKCRQAFESFRPDEFDLVYVNGDNHLPIIKTGEESWKVNLIEETFHARMFDTSDVE